MQFIYGLLTAAVFFLCLFLFFWMGTQYSKKKPPDKPKQEEPSEDVLLKQKQLQENFIKVMNYDVDQATARRKVT
ncbi:hypothetical protein V7150_16095 [Neobacillus drentensis]|uniref:hypothetical protein n=1 Tax=Neobacillus drentensis TaxID=220684 RepID=UPI002FFECF7E